MSTNQIVLSFFYSSQRGSGNELSFVIYICLFTDACCYIYCGKYSKSCLSMFTLYVNTFLEWMSIRVACLVLLNSLASQESCIMHINWNCQ